MYRTTNMVLYLVIAFTVYGGSLAGHTTYNFNRIEGWENPTSQLHFPIDNQLLGVKMNFYWWRYIKASIDIQMGAKTFAPGWEMWDKDWHEDELYLHTLSQAYCLPFRGNFNLSIKYYFFKPSLGVQLDMYEFDIKGIYVVKWDPIYFEGKTYYEGTKVLDYSIQYILPYIGLGFEIPFGIVKFGGEYRYSFLTYASDRDHHILRGLVFDGAYTKDRKVKSYNVHLGIRLNNKFSLLLGYNRTKISLNGISNIYAPPWGHFTDPQDIEADYDSYWMGLEWH